MSLHVFILGMLMEQEHHPYDLKRLLKENKIDKLINIGDGKLYYAFDVLTKKGYIRAVESVHEEKRPNKTVYAITEAGKKALENEIYKQFRAVFDIKALYSAILFMQYADPGKIAYLLEDKIAHMNESLKYKEALLNGNVTEEKRVKLIIDHSIKHQEVELEWLKELLDYVKLQIR